MESLLTPQDTASIKGWTLSNDRNQGNLITHWSSLTRLAYYLITITAHNQTFTCSLDWLIVWIQAGLELMVAHMAMAAQKEREQNHHDDESATKSRWRKIKRGSLIGGSAVTAGVLLAITGGIATFIVLSVSLAF